MTLLRLAPRGGLCGKGTENIWQAEGARKMARCQLSSLPVVCPQVKELPLIQTMQVQHGLTNLDAWTDGQVRSEVSNIKA